MPNRIEKTQPEFDGFEGAREKPKDGWFDQWVIAEGAPLKELVKRNLVFTEFHESKTDPRKRKRRADDQRRFEACVEVLTCNLAYALLNPPESGRVAYRRDNRTKMTRYDNRELAAKTFRSVTKYMQEFGALDLQIGGHVEGVSTIRPTPWFANRVSECGVSLADFGRNELEEVLILSQKHSILTNYGISKNTEIIDYEDTDDTNSLRENIRSLNRFLKSADLDFIDDGDEPVDPYRRTLTRRFVLRRAEGIHFDAGGRLFGAWWLNLKKARRKNIRVQGEPPTELDFSNMFARLAYAKVGLEAPEGDLYDLEGLLEDYDANADHRKGVKKAFNALLFGAKTRLPTEIKKDLPSTSTMTKVRAALELRHPSLAPLFGTDVGFELMFKESQILLRVLDALREARVVGLCLHDAILVPSSKEDLARAIMEDASREVSGHVIPTDTKHWKERRSSRDKQTTSDRAD